MNNDFECKRCGKCCMNCFNAIKATPKDLERWETQQRTDILRYVAFEPIDLESYLSNGMIEMFIDKSKCPFLKEIEKGVFHCMIHNTKPSFCKNYHGNNICEGMKSE